jgi:hypothetical protein
MDQGRRQWTFATSNGRSGSGCRARRWSRTRCGPYAPAEMERIIEQLCVLAGLDVGRAGDDPERAERMRQAFGYIVEAARARQALFDPHTIETQHNDRRPRRRPSRCTGRRKVLIARRTFTPRSRRWSACWRARPRASTWSGWPIPTPRRSPMSDERRQSLFQAPADRPGRRGSWRVAREGGRGGRPHAATLAQITLVAGAGFGLCALFVAPGLEA